MSSIRERAWRDAEKWMAEKEAKDGRISSGIRHEMMHWYALGCMEVEAKTTLHITKTIREKEGMPAEVGILLYFLEPLIEEAEEILKEIEEAKKEWDEEEEKEE